MISPPIYTSRSNKKKHTDHHLNESSVDDRELELLYKYAHSNESSRIEEGKD